MYDHSTQSTAESESRQTRAISLGMDHVLADVFLQRHWLMQQYLEIEAAYIKHLEEVESVYEKTHKMNQRALEFQPSQREVKDYGNLPSLLLLHWASFRHCKAAVYTVMLHAMNLRCKARALIQA